MASLHIFFKDQKILSKRNVFLSNHSITVQGKRRARKDTDTSSRRDSLFKSRSVTGGKRPRLDFEDHSTLRRGPGRIGASKSKTVQPGAGFTGKVAIGG